MARRIAVNRTFGLTLAASLLGASVCVAMEKNPVVVIETSLGTIKAELYEDKAPITVKNFLGYVEDKFYDGVIFHRVIKNFMVQGGGFADGKEKETKASIKNESGNGLSNTRGTFAMARTNAPDSASAQFYINLKDNDFLDKANARDGVGYCVFGKVIDGMDVVDKIAAVKTGQKTLEAKSGRKAPFDDVPVEDVTIKSIRVQK
jgi:cyclophilin family peptidyl-prolyl cis-trans isomerase